MAVNEQISTGNFYRHCIDATTKLWQRMSFWTKSSDVEFNDGKTAEAKVGAIKGLTTSTNVTTTGYAADAKVVSDLNTRLNNCLSQLENTKPAEFKIMENGVFIIPGLNNNIWTRENHVYDGYYTCTVSNKNPVKLYVTTSGTSPSSTVYYTSQIITGLENYDILKIHVTECQLSNNPQYDTTCTNNIEILAPNGSIIDSAVNITEPRYYMFDITSYGSVSIRLNCGGRYSSTKMIAFNEVIAYKTIQN